MVTSELAAKLERRKMSCEPLESDVQLEIPIPRKANECGFRAADFPEFSAKEIKQYDILFRRNAAGGTVLDFDTLKSVLQKLGLAQTHIELKKRLHSILDSAGEKSGDGSTEKVDLPEKAFRIELPTNAIDFRTFMLLFKMLKAEESDNASIAAMFANLQEIDVNETGVSGAVSFFQTKISVLQRDATYEQELREMREEARKAEAEKKERKAAFREKVAMFHSVDSAK